MRTKLMGLILGCGLVAATVVPALACAFHDQQASEQKPQQTAQAQSSDTKSQ